MGEENNTLDLTQLDGSGANRTAVFAGMDAARGRDWSALRCPRCSTPHRFTTRPPKRCRVCDCKFIYR